MADVWECTLTDPTLIGILLVLANSADDLGGNCFPGTSLIAKRARVSERTVVRAIQRLEREGWIEVLQRGCGRPKETAREAEKYRWKSQYQINVWKLKGCHDDTLCGGEKRVTRVQERVTPVQRKGDSDDNPPHPLLGRSVLDPSMNQPPIAPQGGRAAQECEASDAGTEETSAEEMAGDGLPSAEVLDPVLAGKDGGVVEAGARRGGNSGTARGSVPDGVLGNANPDELTGEQHAHLERLRLAGRDADARMWRAGYLEQNRKAEEEQEKQRVQDAEREARERWARECMATLDGTADVVLRELAVTAKGALRSVRAQLGVRTAGLEYWRTGLQMIEAAREYEAAKPRLRYSFGWARFFGEGHWRGASAWPWK
jgi:hypothetical protein